MSLDGYGESSSGGRSSSKKPKKPAKKHWYDRPAKIAERWLEGAEDAITGLPTFAWMAAKANYGKAVDIGKGDIGFDWDGRGKGQSPTIEQIALEMGKGTVDHYKKFLGPVLPGGKESGNWRKSLRYAETHPFDVSLDALMVSGWPGLAAKGVRAGVLGTNALKAGGLGERAALRLTGLKPALSPEGVLAQEQFKLRGGVLSKDGSRAYAPRTVTAPTKSGVDFEVDVAKNPIWRPAQSAILKAGSFSKTTDLPGIGTTSRLGRQTIRAQKQDEIGDLLGTERDFRSIENKMRPQLGEKSKRNSLSRFDAAALELRLTGRTPELAGKAAAERVDNAVARAKDIEQIAEHKALKYLMPEAKAQSLTEQGFVNAIAKRRDVVTEQFNRQHDRLANSVATLQEKIEALHQLPEMTPAVEQKINRLTKQADRFQQAADIIDKAIGYVADAPAQRGVYLTRFRELNRDRLLSRAGNRQLADVLNKENALLYTHPKTVEAFNTPSKLMLRLEAEMRKLAEDSTERLKSEGVSPSEDRRIQELAADAGPMLRKSDEQIEADRLEYAKILEDAADSRKPLTDVDYGKLHRLSSTIDYEKVDQWFAENPSIGDPIVFPAFMRQFGDATPDQLKAYEKRIRQITEGGVVGHAKMSRGWLHDMGLRAFDPRVVRKAHTNIVTWQHRKRQFAQVLSMAVSPGDARFPGLDWRKSGDWVNLAEDARFERHLDAVYKFLEEAPIVATSEVAVDELAELRQLVESALLTKFKGKEPVLIPKSMYNELAGDLERSATLAGRALQSVTNTWRHFALNLSPRWLVNNIVGQTMLMLGTYGIMRTAHSLMSLAEEASRARATGRTSLYQQIGSSAPQIETSGFAHAEVGAAGRGRKIVGKLAAPGNLMGKLNSFLSDDIPRRAAFWIEVRPSVHRLIDSGEASDVREAIRMIMSDPKTNHRITDKVIKNLVDFRDLSPNEKKYMRAAIPFYSWVKGMSRRTPGMIFDDAPFRSYVGAKGGQYAVEKTEEEYGGPLPKFLKGQIILGKNKDGTVRALTTSAMNPFTTPLDVANQAMAPVRPGTVYGTDNPLASVNPWIKTPIETLLNRNIFYGGKIDYSEDSTWLDRMRKASMQQFPQYMTVEKYKRAKNPPPNTNPIYDPNTRDVLLQLFGIPQKHIVRKEAVRRGREEQKGVKQPWL